MTPMKMNRIMVMQKSQQEVSEELGISRSQYAKYEIGLATPNILKATIISEYFNMDLKYLFPEYAN